MENKLHYIHYEGRPLVKPEDPMVDHPPHYQSETGLEVIDVIEAFTFDLKGIEAVCTGNVLKYVCRWPDKNGLQDLKKARWYLNKLIDHVEKLEEENRPIDVLEPKRSNLSPDEIRVAEAIKHGNS